MNWTNIISRNILAPGFSPRNHHFNGYTHYEEVLGISGQEFARNFDFSNEQNQRLSNAKSRIL